MKWAAVQKKQWERIYCDAGKWKQRILGFAWASSCHGCCARSVSGGDRGGEQWSSQMLPASASLTSMLLLNTAFRTNRTHNRSVGEHSAVAGMRWSIPFLRQTTTDATAFWIVSSNTLQRESTLCRVLSDCVRTSSWTTHLWRCRRTPCPRVVQFPRRRTRGCSARSIPCRPDRFPSWVSSHPFRQQNFLAHLHGLATTPRSALLLRVCHASPALIFFLLW